VKNLLLLPLLGLICFSLSAWDSEDQEPPYSYDIYNYYTERSWLLPPSEYYWYMEAARKAPVYNTTNNTYNTYNTYEQPLAPAPAPVPVVIPVVTPDTPGSALDLGTPNGGSNYRFQDLDLSGGSPIMGYQGLPWGTTISQFQSRYHDASEVTDEVDNAMGVRRFVQPSAGDGIQSRQFLFYGNALYEVYVLYGYVDDSITTQMQEILARLYGQPFNTIQRTSESSNVWYNMADIYMNYNQDMQVILTVSDVYDYANVPQGVIMTCLFSNLPVQTTVEAAY
jgi:hypothetical protein